MPTVVERLVFRPGITRYRVGVDNAALAEAVLDMERGSPRSPLAMASSGSWSSHKTLQQSEHPLIRQLVECVRECLADMTGRKEWSLSVWANVLRTGHAIGLHDHAHTKDGPNTWSGCYYVTNGSPIIFPDHDEEDDEDEETPIISVDPEPGLLLVFPATTPHYVESYRGGAPRVSIAFNAR